MELEFGRAGPSDREAVVTTVVRAFAADPAFRYFFPDDATYHAHAGAFAGYLFDRRVASGSVWIAEGGAAAALWDPPAGSDVRSGEPARLDLPAAARDRIDRYEAAVHRLLPPEPHWYLGILATHPDHAGRRLGRRLMAAGVATAHAEGVAAVLETVNPSNVELYQREGWEVFGHTDGGDVPATWMLANRPAVARNARPEKRAA